MGKSYRSHGLTRGRPGAIRGGSTPARIITGHTMSASCDARSSVPSEVFGPRRFPANPTARCPTNISCSESLDELPPVCRARQGSLLPLLAHDVRVHSQTNRQLHAVVEFHERFKDFVVHALGRFVGANILATQFLPDAHHTSREACAAIGISSHVRRLPQRELADVGLIDIYAHSQCALVANREDRVRACCRV